MQLYDYQVQFVDFLCRHLKHGAQEVAISASMGAGKTISVQTLLELLVGTRVCNRALVIAPKIVIEKGFLPPVGLEKTVTFPTPSGNEYISVRNLVTVRRTTPNVPGWAASRDDKTSVSAFLRAAKPPHKVMLTTHSGLARWFKSTSFWPRGAHPLKGQILVVDEAHHLGKDTVLQAVARKWKELGGGLVYVTATPYRTDGGLVFSTDIPWITRTIAEHSLGGVYAPEHFRIRTHHLSSEAPNWAAFVGDVWAGGEGTKSCHEIVDLWNTDQQPKTVIIVPSRSSHAWALNLQRTFEAQIKANGKQVRVLNAVGTDAETARNLGDQLILEREIKHYEDSRWDVILACKRFDEGTDWPLCSHVYNIGNPASMSLIIQRWGRAMRLKANIAGYPAQHANTASFTFLALSLNSVAWDKFTSYQKDRSFLLGAYLADHETAHTYTACVRWRPEDISRRRSGKCKPKPALLEDIAAVEKRGLDPHTLANNLTVIAKIETMLRDLGVKDPKVTQVIAFAQDTLNLPEEVILGIKGYYGHRILTTQNCTQEQDETVDQLTKVAGPDGFVPPNLIADHLRTLWDEVIDKHGASLTVNVAAKIQQYVATLTGQTAVHVARDLRIKLQDITLTLEQCNAAALAYRTRTKSRIPPHPSTDASVFFGFPSKTIYWDSVYEIMYEHREEWGLESCVRSAA